MPKKTGYQQYKQEERKESVDIDPVISFPPPVIEALLVANATGNRAATTDVCNQIREIAEKQGFAQF